MDVKINKDNDREFEFTTTKDASTLMNVLRVYLLENKNIEMVTCTREHPLLDKLYFYVKGEKPRQTVQSAIKNIMKDAKGARKAFA